MKRILSLAALSCALPLGMSAQTHEGELPVDPYEITNENAGGEPTTDENLFDHFHGMDGIDRIIDDTVNRIVVDPRIADIFRASDIIRLRRTLKEQICYLLAGPCDYTGRDMVSSHVDHGITTGEFNALVESLQLAMDAEGIPFRYQNKLLAKLAPMKRDIVTR